ncbi:MAG: hypothetical protein IJU29_08490 [Oscillospiraceae bacterium]|nr:hypothetical protein [Oscillospiraceae bacterium]
MYFAAARQSQRYLIAAHGHAPDRVGCAAASGILTALKAALDCSYSELKATAALEDGYALMVWEDRGGGPGPGEALYRMALGGIEALHAVYGDSLPLATFDAGPTEAAGGPP